MKRRPLADPGYALETIRPSVALAEIFLPQAIIVGSENHTKQGVIAEIIHRLVTLGHIPEQEEKGLLTNILAREDLGTTALGNGVAFPHCRASYVAKFVGALALEPRGIPFDALDGQPVYAVFLLLAPFERQKNYYDVLGRITAIGRDKSQRLYLLNGCRTPEAIHHYFQELDAE
jgi:nitrogen PTS system EIIA component